MENFENRRQGGRADFAQNEGPTHRPHDANRATYRIKRRHYSESPSLEKIDAALSHIPADDRETWWLVGAALKAELGEGGFSTWDTWSQQAGSYRERDCRTVWKSIKTGKVGIGSLFHLAKRHGWKPERAYAPVPAVELERRKAEQEARSQHQAAETEKAHRKAAELALLRWNRATPCTEHPYLTRKRIGSHGLRVGPWEKRHQDEAGTWQSLVIESALLVPMLEQTGELWKLQAIFPEVHLILGRDKDFIGGGRKAGLFYCIGDPTDTVLIAEGYATAATVHEYTRHQTYVAFDCGNLLAVARTVRAMHPGKRITICADNDRHKKGNPGVTKARAAALAIGGYVSVPDFPDGVPGTDFNDLHVYRLGLAEGVRHA